MIGLKISKTCKSREIRFGFGILFLILLTICWGCNSKNQTSESKTSKDKRAATTSADLDRSSSVNLSEKFDVASWRPETIIVCDSGRQYFAGRVVSLRGDDGQFQIYAASTPLTVIVVRSFPKKLKGLTADFKKGHAYMSFNQEKIVIHKDILRAPIAFHDLGEFNSAKSNIEIAKQFNINLKEPPKDCKDCGDGNFFMKGNDMLFFEWFEKVI